MDKQEQNLEYKVKLLAQAALRAPSEVALQCVASHCYYQAACVRHPWWWVEAKLAIVAVCFIVLCQGHCFVTGPFK